MAPQIPAKQIAISIISLLAIFALFIILIWVIFQGFVLLASKLSEASFGIVAQLITTLIILMGTIAAAYFSYQGVLKSKRVEREQNIEQEIRKQKAPTYEKFIAFTSRILTATITGKTVPDKEVIQFIHGFHQQLIIWGDDLVIKAWTRFKNASVDADGEIGGLVSLFAMEDLMYAIREGMGHLNKGLKRGDLLKFYVSDLDDKLQGIELVSAEQIIKNLKSL